MKDGFELLLDHITHRSAAVIGLAIVAGAALLGTRSRPSAANAGPVVGATTGLQSLGRHDPIRGPVAHLDLTRDYAGKIVVINYMASWCTACQVEVPGLVKTFGRFRDRGVQLVGVALQTSRSDTRGMIAKLGIDFPVYMDRTGAAATQRFHLLGMPTTLIFEDGRLLKRFDGEVSGDKLAAYLKTLTG